MWRATKLFKFEAAHRLRDHPGACANIHGHSYRVAVTVEAPNLNQDGMVVDFGVIKEVVRPLIEKMDHSMIVDSNDSDNPIKNMDSKIFVMDGNPTAEKMALLIGLKIRNEISGYGVNVYSVRVWETETSFVEVLL